MERRLLFGLRLDPLRMDEVVERCRLALETRSRVLVGVLNAAKVVNARRDALLRDSLLDCDLLLADGQSIVWASRLLGRPLPERVAGIDLFEKLLELADRDDRSVYLLGARPEILAKLEARIGERFPRLRIAGSHHGYFDDTDAPAIAAGIRASGADMLFLGMVSPKKEIFLATHGASLDVPVLHGVGGSFDVLAGLTRRAPILWQRTGMEWAYRLLQEPRRLLWRYLRANTAFLALTAREFIRPAEAFVVTENKR
ncbi:WecB/TagA/CpsF family glycosyltransferase [Aquamicrobium sp. LC103]|uniref:WecB/TagA/CpsF family glycosyltransferase n=1 Tax=Aquamicrobium sp. LC103 TaxID=1120658 RepID=UPI000A83B027|nr:WecB/TagA/CpsF family glycosyltransferase [Aquamicrobium sp. LC103]